MERQVWAVWTGFLLLTAAVCSAETTLGELSCEQSLSGAGTPNRLTRSNSMIGATNRTIMRGCCSYAARLHRPAFLAELRCPCLCEPVLPLLLLTKPMPLPAILLSSPATPISVQANLHADGNAALDVAAPCIASLVLNATGVNMSITPSNRTTALDINLNFPYQLGYDKVAEALGAALNMRQKALGTFKVRGERVVGMSRLV